jgi:hypothetical protein
MGQGFMRLFLSTHYRITRHVDYKVIEGAFL